MDRLLFEFLHIKIVDLCPDDLIKPCVDGIFLWHRLYLCKRSYLRHLCQNILIVRRCDLRAVLPIYLIAVILSRIMARRNDNTGHTAQMAERKRQLRRRAQTLKYICLNSVCIQTKRRLIRKFRRHPAGIVGNRHALFLSVLRNNIICESLCRLTHGIDIHTVRSRAYNAAQSSRSKFQLTVKTILNLGGIVLDRRKLRFCIRVEIVICTPLLIKLHIAHTRSPSLLCLLSS